MSGKRMGYLYIVLVVSIFFLNGCGKPMPLAKDSGAIDLKKGSIGIFSLKISNKLSPSYQPDVSTINVIGADGKPGKKFKSNKAVNKVDKKFNEYLLSFQLPEGEYKIEDVSGSSGIFPVTGTFSFPINVNFSLDSNSIVYIGNIEMVNRKRKDGEIWSGNLIPLLDQAVTGFSGGTFDVTVSDNYEEDLKRFKKEYPALDAYEIKRNIAVHSGNKSDKPPVSDETPAIKEAKGEE